MSSRSSPTELDAAQAPLSLPSSSRNNLSDAGNQLPVPASSVNRVRPRHLRISQPPRGPKALKVSLVKPDVTRYQQRMDIEMEGKDWDNIVETSFWKILRILRFMTADYATAIKMCDHSGLAEFFIKVDCLVILFGWTEKRTPCAKTWEDHMNTSYSVQDFQELTLWGMIDKFVDGEELRLENLKIKMAHATKTRDEKNKRALRRSIRKGPPEALYMLRCMWWWFREQTHVCVASLQIQ